MQRLLIQNTKSLRSWTKAQSLVLLNVGPFLTQTLVMPRAGLVEALETSP